MCLPKTVAARFIALKKEDLWEEKQERSRILI